MVKLIFIVGGPVRLFLFRCRPTSWACFFSISLEKLRQYATEETDMFHLPSQMRTCPNSKASVHLIL